MTIDRTFLMLSGGPGLKNPKDKEHDQSWANYVQYPLNIARSKLFPVERNEQVVWVIYKPAYEKRWSDDLKKKASSTTELKDKGFTSYVDMLEKRAKTYGWILKWISKNSEFWSIIRTLGTKPVSRFWYFGHAQNDLWLTLEHNSLNEAVMPSDGGAVVWSSDISVGLKPYILGDQKSYKPNTATKIFGCRTASFANLWATTFKVYAEGAVGTLKYDEFLKSINNHQNNAAGCTWVKYKPDGKVM
ncbi:hypothetical protein D3P07_24015 [Paenibacillus sp. 1011MAR3C5]|uniref:hypothetical protein n=1 Tax=Paenibacillus sp. 1011MAR3C5 TaxID=1675787 RepID=UPI000E6BB903|nr:hypothetical protein [Paenibacillus sp. 1011MAR3C5]RJE83881.1 hypothetical protein D3P07_24015 [Paenibacillus sp. 1011MAR3C5]